MIPQLKDLTLRYQPEIIWRDCEWECPSKTWKSEEFLTWLYILREKVSRGGNLLLNVGPTTDGRIPVIMQQRLAEIGEWLNVNGEAIYCTRQWEENTLNTPDTYFTTKGNDLYLIVTEWNNKPITINVQGKIKNISLLGSDKKVSYTNKKGNITIIPLQLNICNYSDIGAIQVKAFHTF
jgi:alpha-L-fucosidase